ncbi:MAG: hypothetical protein V4692_08090 [Bdellovibrionota bacterium]
MSWKARLSLGILLFSVSACSPSGNSGSDGPARTTSSSELDGRWQSNCVDAVLFGNSQRKELVVEGSAMTRVIRVSTAGNCGDSAAEIRETTQISIGREVSDGLNEFDITVTAMSIKPMSQMGASILNSGVGFCGFKDWKVGMTKDITSAAGSGVCYPSLPAAFFDLYTVEGESLYFGEGEAAKEAAIRPTSIDRSERYTKQ